MLVITIQAFDFQEENSKVVVNIVKCLQTFNVCILNRVKGLQDKRVFFFNYGALGITFQFEIWKIWKI